MAGTDWRETGQPPRPGFYAEKAEKALGEAEGRTKDGSHAQAATRAAAAQTYALLEQAAELRRTAFVLDEVRDQVRAGAQNLDLVVGILDDRMAMGRS